jgi:hypothetical protein
MISQHDFAERMLSAMNASRAVEFAALVAQYKANPELRVATDPVLIQEALTSRGWRRIKAVELLGVLKVVDAEQALASLLQQQLASNDFTSENEAAFLLLRVLTALLLIQPKRWQPKLREISTCLSGTWVSTALADVAKAVNPHDNNLGGT